MDIRNWGLDQIMQLPDNCFGSRWPVIVTVEGAGPEAKFAISKQGLPDVCVLWYVEVVDAAGVLSDAEFELRLGDNLPTTWVEFELFDLLLPRIGVMAGIDRHLRTSTYMPMRLHSLRLPVTAQGRRLVVGVDMAHATGHFIQASIVVSSIPTEVPDCLLSV